MSASGRRRRHNPLDISASGINMRLTNTTSGYGADVRFDALDSSATNRVGYLSLIPAVGTDQSYFSFANSTGTNIAIFRADGNVGIGTTAPQASLDIAGTQIQISDPSQALANYSYLKTSAYTSNTQKLTLGTTYGYGAPVDALTIFNGSVGIGTTAPAYPLDVAGYLRTTGALSSRMGQPRQQQP